MTFKEIVYSAYAQLLVQQISEVEHVLADLRQSAANETKSTAGDKHETALAMLQIEQANKRQQLAEMQGKQAILNKINPVVPNSMISAGALVKTNVGYFFVCAALGKIIVQDEKIIALSIASPLGQQFCRHKAGDTIALNGQQYQIISVE